MSVVVSSSFLFSRITKHTKFPLRKQRNRHNQEGLGIISTLLFQGLQYDTRTIIALSLETDSCSAVACGGLRAALLNLAVEMHGLYLG